MDCNKILAKKIDSWNYFDSLVAPKYEHKKVKCLRCQKEFVGAVNKRLCAKCSHARTQKCIYA
jgi:hypothetical protein